LEAKQATRLPPPTRTETQITVTRLKFILVAHVVVFWAFRDHNYLLGKRTPVQDIWPAPI